MAIMSVLTLQAQRLSEPILGGELSNSAATSVEDIDEVMPRMRALGLNTVLVPAYWELMELDSDGTVLNESSLTQNPMLLMISFVIPDADEVVGWGEGTPGDVKPGGGGQELVGVLPCSEEVNESHKLRWVFRADVGSLADEVLGVLNAAHLAIHSLAAEA